MCSRICRTRKRRHLLQRQGDCWQPHRRPGDWRLSKGKISQRFREPGLMGPSWLRMCSLLLCRPETDRPCSPRREKKRRVLVAPRFIVGVPHIFLMREVHASRLIAWREQLLKRPSAFEKITYTDLLVKVVARALREH